MQRHHVIISGTGRNGSTFLVQLLTYLKFDTGFKSITDDYYEYSNSGMEWELNDPDAPYIVKSPWLCTHLADIIEYRNLVIDYAIIPMRDIHNVVESRKTVQKKAEELGIEQNKISGGLWKTTIPEEQELVLYKEFFNLLMTLTKYDIPTVFLFFPKFVIDAEYLFKKLQMVFKDLNKEDFMQAFTILSDPSKVHFS